MYVRYSQSVLGRLEEWKKEKNFTHTTCTIASEENFSFVDKAEFKY